MKTKLLYLFVIALLLLPAACGDEDGGVGNTAETQEYTAGEAGDGGADIQEYAANDISILLPASWQASYEASQQQIMLETPGDGYALGIQILETGDASAEQFALAMSAELNGEAPHPSIKYGEYEFSCEIMKFPANINILTKDGYSLVLVEVGDFDQFAEQADSVIKSMKSGKPEFQNVISAIRF